MIDELSLKWHQAKKDQPQFLNECYKICLRAKARGFTHWSIDACFHVLRFETALSTRDKTCLKINNDFSAFASRELMDTYPELKGFFRIRQQKPRGTWGHIS
tara:strand:+ start:208 stop:513 length:306 start_codon:yes stop_codon:yes gene_type:complete